MEHNEIADRADGLHERFGSEEVDGQQQQQQVLPGVSGRSMPRRARRRGG